MLLNKWNLAIISTDYDLKEERKYICSKLNKFHILAFEDKSYPVEPGLHSHDVCLKAIETSDVVILIVNKRYGGLYKGTGPLSITEMEYKKAVELDKYIIPCINSKAWDERHAILKLKGRRTLPKDEFKTTYTENHNVIRFIDSIHKSPLNNFIVIYDNKRDLFDKVEGRLRGNTRAIMEDIVNCQREHVRSKKTTTGMAFSIGDVLEKGYFIEPPYKVMSGHIFNKANMTNSIIHDLKKKQSVGLTGGPGTGKSTIIAKTYLEHAHLSVTTKSNEMPFFVSLRGKSENYHFDFKEFINDCFAGIYNKEPYPYIDFAAVNPIMYLDGFDELTENVSKLDLDELIKSKMMTYPFLLTYRARFSESYMANTSFTSKMSLIVNLNLWNKEKTTKYIKQFCRINNITADKMGDIISMLFESTTMEDISTNPLLVTLYLWIIEVSGMRLPLDIHGKISMLDKVIELWAKREIERVGTGTIRNNTKNTKLLMTAWEFASWELYRCRYDQHKLYFDNLVVILNDRISDRRNTFLTRELFDTIFVIRPILNDIDGMIHEQLLEHLVAKAIINGIINKAHPFPLSLKYIIRPEINKSIRGVIESENRQVKIKIVKTLWGDYKNRINKQGTSDVMMRNQAMYYIGRIDEVGTSEILKKALKLEDNINVKLSIMFGLIKKGNYEVENTLYELLNKHRKWDRANRGYHLVYYRDWITLSAKPPFLDPENIVWIKTLNALIRHIMSGESKHIALRRIEYFTIKRFIETRGVETLESDTIKSIKKVVKRMKKAGVPDEYIDGVNKEVKMINDILK